jgi:hypothetical protein
MYIENMNRETQTQRENEKKRTHEKHTYTHTHNMHVYTTYIHIIALVRPRHPASVSGNTECLGMNPKIKEVQSVVQRFSQQW